MILIVVGLLIWSFAHFFRRLDPPRRLALGTSGKGMVAGFIGFGLLLIIVGYRLSPEVAVYNPPVWGTHVNNILVLVGFYLFAVSGAKTRLARHIRHPMLIGVALWAVAHLFANGDLASLLLFGGFLAWAFAEIALINRAEPVWTEPPEGPLRKEFTSLLATLVLFAFVAAIHSWLGYYPFG